MYIFGEEVIGSPVFLYFCFLFRKKFQIVLNKNGLRLVPELYKVPFDKVAEEKQQHGSQDREAYGAM